jgi:Rrf2 family protein
MQITTRSRYATRALLEIALAPGESPTGVRAIAERQEIPAKYLASLFKQLRSAGLVRSVRGARGGYVLAQSPADITVWDVVSAMEGSSSVVACTHDAGTCHRSAECVLRNVWQQVDNGVRQILEGISMADLIAQHEQKQASQALNYVI